ncbi:MAG: hypothetical protein US49_C0010G0007 [candidate division TM6 bacterium GW2011_GWF2_37_49]|nr:MAG: hypothetical protein US49_C0010G0007 [candidate division TM6 bacterium GW2011_GWF2_37_49]
MFLKGEKMLLKKIPLISAFLCCFVFNLFSCDENDKKHCIRTPKLAVVLIVDQFAYHYISKVKPFLKYGLKDFLDNGVVFENAYHPHGIPETTPGHHGLCVGTCAKDHGAVANDWVKTDGTIEQYVDDPECPMIGAGQTEDKIGKSNKKTRVDGLSDQFVLKSTNKSHNKVFALSLKSHPAIATACRMGKAVWLDSSAGQFVSSTAYFDKLPEWLIKFNEKHPIQNMYSNVWQTAYPKDSSAYDFLFCDNYEFTAYKESMIGRSIDDFCDNCIKRSSNTDKGECFVKNPQSSQLLLDLAKQCIKANFNKDGNERMLLWVSLSNLDLLTHFYGPDCMEPLDLIYHIDKQIGDFTKFLKKIVNSKDLLVVLTADHGVGPIPEIARKKGHKLACRIMAESLVKKMNDFIKQNFGLEKVVLDYEPTSFRLNREVMQGLGKTKQRDIMLHLTHFLKYQPGIKNAWICEDLRNSTFEPFELENFYKNQIYKNRSGDIICQPEPYCQITKYPTGTSHMTPYDYDTHVPLMIYQKGQFERKNITLKVWIPQLPVTLAKVLGVGKPSASTFEPLPGF